MAYAVSAPLSREQEVGRASKEGFGRATGFLRARLAQQLDLKKLPKLSFGRQWPWVAVSSSNRVTTVNAFRRRDS